MIECERECVEHDGLGEDTKEELSADITDHSSASAQIKMPSTAAVMIINNLLI